MRARRTPITDAVADTAWDCASDDYSAYAKMLKNARELEEKLQAATKQRDALIEVCKELTRLELDRVDDSLVRYLVIALQHKAEAAIASAKGAQP